MKNGPVPSGVYDMLNAARDGMQYLHFPEAEEAFDVVGTYTVQALRGPDLGWLSASELECLDEALHLYDGYSFKQLTRLSHDAAWHAADENDTIPIAAIVESLGNPDGLLEQVTDPNP